MIILGLGSNIGDRAKFLKTATEKLSSLLTNLQKSRIYESQALLPAEAPATWDTPFLNMAVMGDSSLNPHALLLKLKAIERELGREDRGLWGPREIDIDILAIDNMVIDEVELHVPHRDVMKRDFALLPFADIAPDWRFPREGEFFGMSVKEIITQNRFCCGTTLKETGITLYAV